MIIILKVVALKLVPQKNADVEFGANKIVNCKTAIELRDPPGFIESLGLRRDTPIDKVLQVLSALSEGKTNQLEIKSVVKEVELIDWLSGVANVSTLINVFYQLTNSSLVQQAIALLSEMSMIRQFQWTQKRATKL